MYPSLCQTVTLLQDQTVKLLSVFFQDGKIAAVEALVNNIDAVALAGVPADVAALEVRVDTLEAAGNAPVDVAGVQAEVDALEVRVDALEPLTNTVTGAGGLVEQVTANCQKIKEVTDVAGTPGVDNDDILTNILAVASNVC